MRIVRLALTALTAAVVTISMLVAVVFRYIFAFRIFSEVWLLTGGGPNPEKPTTTIPYLIYGRNSIISGDLGTKSAAAVLLFVLSLALALVQFRGLDRRVHYGR